MSPLTNNINVSTKLRLAVEEIRTDLHLWLKRAADHSPDLL